MSKINLGRVAGKSAYEVAVDTGFTGTQTEWLESLKPETDQTYSATSENAQSGKAVAEALEGISSIVDDINICTANSNDLRIGKTAYANGIKLFGTNTTGITTSWDVSASNDGSVMAYLYPLGNDTYDLVLLGLQANAVVKDYTYSTTPWYSNYRTKIKHFIVGSKIATLGKNIVARISSIEEIHLDSATDLKTIDAFAISGYTTTPLNITDDYKIILPTNLQTVNKQAFVCLNNNVLFDFSRCTNLQTIGENAFYQYLSIGKPYQIKNLPSSVTSIGLQAFYNATHITPLKLNNNASIGKWAFAFNDRYSNGVSQQGIDQDFNFSDTASITELAFLGSCCGVHWKGNTTSTASVHDIPGFYTQRKPEHKSITYGSSTIYKSGCVLCDFMMLINSFTNTTVTIQDMINDATTANAISENGNTIYITFANYVCNKYNLTHTVLFECSTGASGVNQTATIAELKTAIRTALSAGKIVFIGANSHGWLLRGITANGEIYVADPEDLKLNTHTQSIDYVTAGTMQTLIAIDVD